MKLARKQRTIRFAVSGRWALAADNLQWMLQRRYRANKWEPLSFVSSTKTVLARCLREKHCPPADAERLLAGLPATFDEWLAAGGGATVGRHPPYPTPRTAPG